MAKRKRGETSSAGATGGAQQTSERAFLIAEIERLNSAIDELKGEADDDAGNEAEASVSMINGALRQLLAASDASRTAAAATDAADDDGLSQQLHALANLTGITFTEATSSRNRTNSQTLRHFSLAGNCFDLDFALVFDVDEADTKICTLDVTVPASAATELHTFIASVKDSLSPQAFFRGFVQYAEWNKQRSKLFSDLRQGNPELVKLPLGSACAWLMQVDSPRSKGFAFNIVWRLVVNGDGQVRCDLRFLPRCKAEGAAAKTGFAPRFQSLVRLRGIERALHILVDLVTAG